VGDWVKFRRSITVPTYGWQGANQRSVGFVQAVLDHDTLLISFCSGEARVLLNEVIKIIPLNRGQHVQLKSDVRDARYDEYLIFFLFTVNFIKCQVLKS
jgi:E3 ubiquitin-protein ligase KEG